MSICRSFYIVYSFNNISLYWNFLQKIKWIPCDIILLWINWTYIHKYPLFRTAFRLLGVESTEKETAIFQLKRTHYVNCERFIDVTPLHGWPIHARWNIPIILQSLAPSGSSLNPSRRRKKNTLALDKCLSPLPLCRECSRKDATKHPDDSIEMVKLCLFYHEYIAPWEPQTGVARVAGGIHFVQ